MSDQFHYTSTLDPLARPLLEQLTFEYDSRYGSFFDKEGASKEINRYPAEVFQPPHGNFLLLLREGRAIAGGAFMAHADEGTAEFKRIWTDASLRRQGLARKVLLELEAQAVRQGYSRVYLTTGFRQPEAVGLYLTNGYTALFDTTAPPETIVKLPFEKHLKAVSLAQPHHVQPSIATVRQSA
ncbi:GNAT family N-acetyltransferase [Rhizobium oryzicola]|uniref:GNAT family N-acetyltransferase n=1 Tax=Rhizobium oryzicola TaxID=1232668 RepID=A0ABT8SZB8_9HYPH|nr:GNAT family N-acetyltransferase [Rhizobium oryzicola]MDO1583802.1 GNAT family N-acetyltransferase [Rhizobium oryzicola]